MIERDLSPEERGISKVYTNVYDKTILSVVVA